MFYLILLKNENKIFIFKDYYKDYNKMDYLKIDENIIQNSFKKNDLKHLLNYIINNEIIKYNLE